MKIIDLTQTIHHDMPVYPGTKKPILQKVNTIEKNGFAETRIDMFSHTGTHIDAPAHMLQHGVHLDNINVDNFIGYATILDFSKEKLQTINVTSCKIYEELLEGVEFIIIKTGWSKYWGEDKYYKDFPFLSDEAAQWLTQYKLKGIGIDAISIDNACSTSYNVHKTFMRNNIIIIENLTNLDAVSKQIFILSIMPLKIKDVDGSPVRAVAIEDI